MNRRPIDVVNIVPGNFCNLRCSHCVNNSGPDRRDKLSESEIETLSAELNRAQPKLILLTGGEPTLHMPLINKILKHLTYDFEVQITTNGWFAKTTEGIERVLSGFLRLDRVQLSYDVFHGSKLQREDVKRLADACTSRGLRFNMTMCISEAMDLVTADELTKEIGHNVVYQKVARIGRAEATDTEFKQPRFDRAVLNKRCSNLSTLTYVHGKGFTFCCGPLVFDTDAPIAHPTVEEHFQSHLRREFETKTFGQLLQDVGGTEAELTPAMSHPCALCHHIQRRGCRAKSS